MVLSEKIKDCSMTCPDAHLQITVHALDGDHFMVRVPDTKTGRDLQELVSSRVAAKTGATIALQHDSRPLSLRKSLKEQLCHDGVELNSLSLSFVYLPCDIASAWSLIRGLPATKEEFALEGITQLSGASRIDRLHGMLPLSLRRLSFGDFFNRSF